MAGKKEAMHPVKTDMIVTFAELSDAIGPLYKVTKRVPDLSVAETRLFRSKERAKKQFERWLE